MEQRTYAKLKSGNILFNLLCVYYFLSTIMPIVSQVINARFFMITIVIIYMLIIFVCDDLISFLIPILIPIILRLIYIYMNDRSNLILYVYQQMIILMPICISYFLIKNNKKNLLNKFLALICVAFVITSITSSFGLVNDPMAARIIATIQDSKSDVAIQLNLRNIGGYEIVYSIVLMYPMIVCMYKYKKISKISIMLSTSCFTVYLFLAQYTTAIILFSVNLTLLIMPRKFSARSIKKLGIIAIILIVSIKPFLAKVFEYFSYMVTSVTLSERFLVISDMFNGIESSNDSTMRFRLYQSSIDRFLRNPLTGNMFSDNILGGHSFMLDTAAQFGLIGIILVFIMYRQIYIKLYRPFRKKEYYGYMVFVFLQTLVLSTINTGQFLFTLCLFSPAVGYILQQQNYKVVKGGAVLYEDNVDN